MLSEDIITLQSGTGHERINVGSKLEGMFVAIFFTLAQIRPLNPGGRHLFMSYREIGCLQEPWTGDGPCKKELKKPR